MGTKGQVRVWDPAVRVFHWSLVASVLVELAFEAGTRLHVIAGYAVLALVSFRLAWGFVGSQHARFADFVTPPRAIIGYLKDLTAGHAARTLGHNPAGGAMIIALLAVLILAALTGALLDTDMFWGNKVLEETHEAIAGSLYILVPVHLAGVVISSILHRENLIAAMVTGWKKR